MKTISPGEIFSGGLPSEAFWTAFRSASYDEIRTNLWTLRSKDRTFIPYETGFAEFRSLSDRFGSPKSGFRPYKHANGEQLVARLYAVFIARVVNFSKSIQQRFCSFDVMKRAFLSVRC